MYQMKETPRRQCVFFIASYFENTVSYSTCADNGSRGYGGLTMGTRAEVNVLFAESPGQKVSSEEEGRETWNTLDANEIPQVASFLLNNAKLLTRSMLREFVHQGTFWNRAFGACPQSTANTPESFPLPHSPPSFLYYYFSLVPSTMLLNNSLSFGANLVGDVHVCRFTCPIKLSNFVAAISDGGILNWLSFEGIWRAIPQYIIKCPYFRGTNHRHKPNRQIICHLLRTVSGVPGLMNR